MAEFERRRTTTVRHEYLAVAPVTHVDIFKAVTHAKHCVAQAKGITADQVCDDEVMVTTDDEHVIVYWEEKSHGG